MVCVGYTEIHRCSERPEIVRNDTVHALVTQLTQLILGIVIIITPLYIVTSRTYGECGGEYSHSTTWSGARQGCVSYRYLEIHNVGEVW